MDVVVITPPIEEQKNANLYRRPLYYRTDVLIGTESLIYQTFKVFTIFFVSEVFH